MSHYSGLFSINDERVGSTAGLNPRCIKPAIFRAELSCWCKSYVALRMKTSLQNLYVRHQKLVDPRFLSFLYPQQEFFRTWLNKYHFGCHIRIMNCLSCARIWVLPGGFRVARLLSVVVYFLCLVYFCSVLCAHWFLCLCILNSYLPFVFL